MTCTADSNQVQPNPFPIATPSDESAAAFID